MNSHNRPYEVVVTILHGTNDDAVTQYVLEVTLRWDWLFYGFFRYLRVEVRGPCEIEHRVLRGQVILLIEHAEEIGQVQLARVDSVSEKQRQPSRLIAVLVPGVVVQGIVIINGNQHGIPSNHHHTSHLLGALLQLLLHIRHNFVGLRIIFNCRPYVTRTIHTVQH